VGSTEARVVSVSWRAVWRVEMWIRENIIRLEGKSVSGFEYWVVDVLTESER
jgi:hypothetical protein